jgi:hypothetical protein
MPRIFCSLFAATVALAPAPALAQLLAPEPPVAIVEPPPGAIVQPPLIAVPAAPLTEVDAAQIALMNGMAVVEDVDIRMWDGNFEVDGEDITGEDVVMRIDRATGQVLSIDD